MLIFLFKLLNILVFSIEVFLKCIHLLMEFIDIINVDFVQVILLLNLSLKACNLVRLYVNEIKILLFSTAQFL